MRYTASFRYCARHSLCHGAFRITLIADIVVYALARPPILKPARHLPPRLRARRSFSILAARRFRASPRITTASRSRRPALSSYFARPASVAAAAGRYWRAISFTPFSPPAPRHFTRRLQRDDCASARYGSAGDGRYRWPCERPIYISSARCRRCT